MMKNMNSTIILSVFINEIKRDGNKIVSLEGVFDQISPNKINGKYYIKNMALFLTTSIVLDDNCKNKDDLIDRNKIYECAIKMTHQATQKAIIIDEFELKINENDITKSDKDIYEFGRITKLSDFYLPEGLGDYSLKLLIREKTDDKKAPWNVQVVHTITIGNYH